ncbi:acetylornithine transaminase [Actinocorallia sp. A-T 12471]|uniref:acetylornithine transaminase n=1 Tax=Actinocorallia sp. A-T 12471 TaxID=3089813 RepID=UPI0029D1A429|nr:acetylornithine transaminase [Actinocorallia sp. A-T 12471]MDX6745051.1 acetylornithine transaminase [Actinocorallia sp. A-T 12471]
MTWQEDFKAAFMPNRPLPPLVLARGEGRTVWDVDGNAYLDMFAGIAVSALGHAHPALVAAVTEQVGRIAHVSPLLTTEPEMRLAAKLIELLGLPGKVYFGNSGTEANEAAFKMVRKHAGPDKYLVSTENSFHGRTMGALALTGKKAARAPFEPFAADVRFVPYGDADALREAVTDRCAGVFLEPTQGEAGVVPPPPGYLAAAREICDATGALLVLDEIQSGIGRTGTWYAHQHEGVRPDILTLAKGLGGGIPIGAVIGVGDAADIFALGDHGCTFGGNPVSSAAALAVLETIERDGLMAHAVKIGDLLAAGIAGIDHPLLAGVRGRGLWLAFLLTSPVAAEVRESAQKAGFLVNNVQPDAIRLAPALTMTEDEARSFVAALPAILDGAKA